ncbi:MAG: spermidine synthase [Gammaproteobacteria bacterium RIFCSPHIGHO2_12_FULL_45_9]|nr:MAG: spermidine synthase [Gammaproteobacteria bacterium RIFCSPHIGHO2_12_FULL_45_9]
MSLWCDEVNDHVSRFGLKIHKTLFHTRSPFQDILVVETDLLGRALMLDGMWMTAEGDEKSYHEMLVHPALCTAPHIARILVIGGGDGGTVREVLKYPEVQQVDLVEIDELVVQACQQHLPSIGTAWHDPRLTLTIADGIEWVKTTKPGTYDIILVDGSDPKGPAVGLFDHAFYEACARALTPHGIFVSQAESPVLMQDVHIDMVQALQKAFGHAYPYYGTVMIYPGGLWSWIYAARTTQPTDLKAERVARITETTEIWNKAIHHGAFAVPNRLQQALQRS